MPSRGITERFHIHLSLSCLQSGWNGQYNFLPAPILGLTWIFCSWFSANQNWQVRLVPRVPCDRHPGTFILRHKARTGNWDGSPWRLESDIGVCYETPSDNIRKCLGMQWRSDPGNCDSEWAHVVISNRYKKQKATWRTPSWRTRKNKWILRDGSQSELVSCGYGMDRASGQV